MIANAEVAYHALVRELSQELPAHGLYPDEIKITPADLAIVFAQHGARDVILDALTEEREEGEWHADGVAARLLNTDGFLAAMTTGLGVMTAVHSYAAKLLCADIHRYRDEPLHWSEDPLFDLGDRADKAYADDYADRSIFLRPQAG